MSDAQSEVRPGHLYVVATPIGNLGDLSPRALKILDGVDLIAAEDTRVTGALLSHFGVRKKLLALHEHNEGEATAEVIDQLRRDRSVAHYPWRLMGWSRRICHQLSSPAGRARTVPI